MKLLLINMSIIKQIILKKIYTICLFCYILP